MVGSSYLFPNYNNLSSGTNFKIKFTGILKDPNPIQISHYYTSNPCLYTWKAVPPCVTKIAYKNIIIIIIAMNI